MSYGRYVINVSVFPTSKVSTTCVYQPKVAWLFGVKSRAIDIGILAVLHVQLYFFSSYDGKLCATKKQIVDINIDTVEPLRKGQNLIKLTPPSTI